MSVSSTAPRPLKMPVGQLIRYVSSLCSASDHIAEVAARLGFDVARFRHQPFVRLSGGQKQKLLIATALGRDTDVLILDEPAANLDPEARGLLRAAGGAARDAVMLISVTVSTRWRRWSTG